MAGDARIEALVGHLDAMLETLAEITARLDERQTELGQSEAERQMLALVLDERKRAQALAATLEDEILGQIIGLNNLAGVVSNYLARRGGA